MNHQELVDKITDEIMSDVDGSGSDADPDSKVIEAYKEIYTLCPKYVTDRISFEEILSGMLDGTGKALIDRMRQAVREVRSEFVEIPKHEMKALQIVVRFIKTFPPPPVKQ
jgi:hypothetical protein